MDFILGHGGIVLAAILIFLLVLRRSIVNRADATAGEAIPKNNFEDTSTAREESQEEYSIRGSYGAESGKGAYFFKHFYDCFDAGKYEEAEEFVKGFLVYCKLKAADYCNVGYLYSKQNKTKVALKHYKEAIKLNPDFAIAYNRLANELLWEGKYLEAIPYLDKAIDLDSNFAFAYNNRAWAKIMSGELQEGLADLQKSELINPENPYISFCYGLYAMQNQEATKALSYFMKTQEMDAKNWIRNIAHYIQQAQEKL